MLEKLFKKSLVQFMYAIGYFGEEITLFYAIIVLYLLSKTYLFVYFVTYSVFKIFVEQLKEITRDLRPDHPVKFLNTNRFDDGRPGELKGRSYGMPSGHASGVAFTLTFVYLFTYKYLIPSIAFLGVTVYERHTFRNHTLAQLFVGSVFGITMASIVVYILKKYTV
jgi:membrane-associated phospholipid phosphatase